MSCRGPGAGGQVAEDGVSVSEISGEDRFKKKKDGRKYVWFGFGNRQGLT